MLLRAELVVHPGGTVQPGEDKTPCFVGREALPDQPDRLVSITNTAGMSFGRMMTGKYISHPGVRITVRAMSDEEAGDLTQTLARFFQNRTTRQSVPVRGRECFISSIYQNGDPIPLGEEKKTRRYLWSLNLRVSLEDTPDLPVE